MTKTLLCALASVLLASCGGVGSNPGTSGSSGADAGLGCCAANFDLYSCQHGDGTTGLACHNPAMGCASSLTCGQGCDPEVSGRCQCVQNVLCVIGSHFDRALCKCVPDAAADAGAGCVQNVLCIMGDHFDRNLCKCVPNTTADAGAGCVQNVLCVMGDHFDRDLCKCVPNTTADAGAGCVQNVLCVMGDHFDRNLCKCVPNTSAP